MIKLRQVTTDDSSVILEWRNDPRISAYMYTDHEISPAEHAMWLERLVSMDDRMGWIVLLDGHPVGAAFVTDIDRSNRNAVWAFYLADPAVRGRGVGSAVEAFVLRTAFDELELHKLSCEVMGFNENVIAMHRKFGFQDEGVFRQEKLKNGQWQDVYRLAYFEQDWERDKERIRALASGTGSE